MTRKSGSTRRAIFGLSAAALWSAAPAVAAPLVERPVAAGAARVPDVPKVSEARPISNLTAPPIVLPPAAGLADDEIDAASPAPDISPKLAAERAAVPSRRSAPSRGAIEALARGAATSASFDGSSPVWSEEPGSVRALGIRDGRLLINGREPRELRPAATHGGVSERFLIHPDDPGLLVMLYHSPDSVDSFHNQTGKVERLTPLADVGAAPEIVEHGEASIRGFGRVYFYVQRLVHGVKLSELAEGAWPTGAVEGLFERLERAGLKLETLGPDASWLAERILAGADGSGGATAYLLDGKTEPGTAADLARHYAMLRALMPEVSAPARDGQDPRFQAAVAAARSAAAGAPLAERLIPERVATAAVAEAGSTPSAPKKVTLLSAMVSGVKAKVRDFFAPRTIFHSLEKTACVFAVGLMVWWSLPGGFKAVSLAGAGMIVRAALEAAAAHAGYDVDTFKRAVLRLADPQALLWTAIIGILTAAAAAGTWGHLAPLAETFTGLSAGAATFGLMLWLPTMRRPKPVDWKQRRRLWASKILFLGLLGLGLNNWKCGFEGAASLLNSPTMFIVAMAALMAAVALMLGGAVGSVLLNAKLRLGIDFPGRRAFELLSLWERF